MFGYLEGLINRRIKLSYRFGDEDSNGTKEGKN